jgi:hypothetical protein
MRTKIALLSAAAMAAGLLSASAQVYSVNVVGYVNQPLQEGFNLVGNPQDFGGATSPDNVTNVMGQALPANTQVYVYNGAGYNISTFIKNKAGTATNWSPIIMIDPGLGAWIKIPAASGGARTNTYTGEVKQGVLNHTNLAPAGGLSMVASIPPLAGFINTNLSYNGGANDQIYKWTNNGTASGYQIFTYIKNKAGTATNWSPSVPQLSVAEGAWLKSSAGQAWVQNFTVQ